MVSLIVGFSIIHFSKNVLEDSKNRLARFGDDDVAQDNIIELQSGTPSQIAYLADQCYKQGKDMIDSNICFAVKLENVYTLTEQEVKAINESFIKLGYSEEKLDVSALQGDTTAIFIYYDIMDKVQITK